MESGDQLIAFLQQRIDAERAFPVVAYQALEKDSRTAATDAMAWTLVTHGELLSPSMFSSLSTLLVDRLLACVPVVEADLSPFEALQYLRALFVLNWRFGAEFNSCVNRIVERLPSVVSNWPSEEADRVVLVFMEHILPMPGVRCLFDKWKTDPVLRPVLEESLRLAGLGEA